MASDFNGTILSSRSEIRRRRWDLAVNPPTDADAYNMLMGGARWLRTIQIKVKNGREADFEERVKRQKRQLKKGANGYSLFHKSSLEPRGNTYYVTTIQPTLAAFDSAPSCQNSWARSLTPHGQKPSPKTKSRARP